MFRAVRLAFLLASLSVLPLGAQGVITTFAGTDWVFPGNGKPAASAPLGAITDLTVDSAGNPVLTDHDNCMVARINVSSPTPTLSLIAGIGTCDLPLSGDGGPATSASTFAKTTAFDSQGNLYLGADTQIRKISSRGIISPFAGDGSLAFAGDGGQALKASFSFFLGMACDSAGNLYIADTYNRRVRRIATNGIVSTFAGNGTEPAGAAGDGGLATSAAVSPVALTFDTAGNLYIAGYPAVRKVAPDGTISTVATILSSSIAFDSAGVMYIGGSSAIYKLPPGTATPIQIAGDPNKSGFFGDGGRALDALFHGPLHVAVGRNGEIYVGDEGNFRVRRISTDGVVTTIAGNGRFRYAGEGQPALASTLNRPFALAVGSGDSIFFSDGYRVRKVADGAVTTVAGDGTPPTVPGGGDQGPASQAQISAGAITLDAAGNLYIADITDGVSTNSRIRKITPLGTISTYAAVPNLNTLGLAFDPDGNLYVSEGARVVKVDKTGVQTVFAGSGQSGSSVNSGLAVNATFTIINGLAVDRASNVYISDSTRLYKVTPQGNISLFAGNGDCSAPHDDGLATLASVLPEAMTFDSAGNLYVTDNCHSTVRRITPQGIISTVAGGGSRDQLGDGKIAPSASLNSPWGLAFDSKGILYIADSFNHRIRVVLATPPTIQVQQSSLAFSGASGGAPITQPLTIQGSISGLEFQVEPDPASQEWLSVEASSASTPRLLGVTVDPSNLAPGDYVGAITIKPTAAQPAQIRVIVSLHVDPALPPRLDVDKDHLSLAFPRSAAKRISTIKISNTGGGTVAFTASATVSTGSSWLSVAPNSGAAQPGRPVNLAVTADPASLGPGTYSGSISIQAGPAGNLTLPVTVTVSDRSQALLLTQTGHSFTTVVQGGIVPSQSFGVVNSGTGQLSWTVSTSTLAGGNWLVASPQSGVSDASQPAPQVYVSINPAGLAPSTYYGLLSINSPGAANSPQVVTVSLQVLKAGSDPGATVNPPELLFPTFSSSPPGSLTLLVYNVGGTAMTFRTGRSEDGFPFFALPQQGVLDPSEPTRVIIQPSHGTPVGTESSTLTFQFSDGRVVPVNLTLIASSLPSSSSGAGALATARDVGCAPTTLVPAFTTLPQSFAVSAGWPSALGVDVRDDCGSPHTTGYVVVSFSNGDPPISLQSLGDGGWQATWQTRRSSTNVSLKVDAVNPQLQISGTRQIDGSLGSLQDPPIASAGSIGSAAGFVPFSALAPGGIISIYGERLAENTVQNQTTPLPTMLSSTSVLIGGKLAPLFFVGQGQINTKVPAGLNINTNHQLVIQRGLTYSLPIPVSIASAQPAAFQASGHAIAMDFRDPLAPFLVAQTSPAKAGDVLVIYCTGLGLTDQSVPDDSAAPSSPLARTSNPVTATIGSRPASVQFAGLAPGFVGLYQINLVVPGGVPPSPDAPLVLTVAGQTGPASLLSVQ